MALAGTLEIQMLANLARLQKDMDEAKRTVGGAMAVIERNIKSVMGLFGVGISAGMFISIVKNSIDAADKLNDLSKSTGIAVTELAGLKLAAAQSGGDLNSVADSINKLSVNMGKDAERFKALGITAKDPLEAFKQLADVFKLIEDPQQRAAVATAAVGKSWAGAAPLLAEGGAKIQEVVDKGKKLSGMTQEMADRSDEFNDSIAKLQTQLGGVGTSLANQLLPTLIDVTKELNNFNSSGTGLVTFSKGIGEVFKVVVVLGANVGYVIKQIANEMAGLAAQAAIIADKGLFDKGARAQVAEISRVMKEQAAAARAEIDAFSERIMNPPKVVQEAVAAAPAVDSAAAQAAADRAAAFLKTTKDSEEAAKHLAKLDAEALSRRAEQFDILEKNKLAIIEGTLAMRQSTEEMGLTQEALLQLKLARVDDTIAIQERKLAILSSSGFETEEIKLIRETIAALKDSKTAMGERDAAMRNENAQAIGESYAASIVKGMKSGNIGKSILADIQDSFEKNVLEPQIKAVVMEAMPLFEFKDGALVSNTAALQANTAALGGSSASSATGAGGTLSGGSSGMSSTLTSVFSIAALAYLAYSFFESTSYKRSGIKGSVGPEGVSAQGWSDEYNAPSYVASIFGGSDSYLKTTFDLTAKQLAYLNTSFETVRANTITFAEQLGLGTEAIEQYTLAFDISNTQSAIDALFKRVSEEMSYAMLGVDVAGINSAADAELAAAKKAHMQYVGRAINYESESSTDRAARLAAEARFNTASQGSSAALQAALPEWFKNLQKNGESLSDTLKRVGDKVVLVRGFIETLGSSLYDAWVSIGDGVGSAITYMDLFVDRLGGIEDATSKLSNFISVFADDKTLQDLAQRQLEAVGLPLLKTTEEWFALAQKATEDQLATILNNQPVIQAWLDAMGKIEKAMKAAFNKETFATMTDYLRAVGHQANGVTIPIDYGVANLPSYAVGTPYVPFDQIAQIHKGERITPAAANDELVTEIKELRREVSMLRTSSDLTARSTKKTSDLLTNVTQDGQSLLTTAA
jgi:hypothetical protein